MHGVAASTRHAMYGAHSAPELPIAGGAESTPEVCGRSVSAEITRFPFDVAGAA